MARPFIIFTDTTTDLPASYKQENNLKVLSLSFTVDGGQTYHSDDGEITIEEFYQKMRTGIMPSTSQVNPEQAVEAFEKYLTEGMDILHIAFSSGLSGSCHSTMIAAEELREKYPEATIIIVDSLCASLGEGLLVHKAVEMKKQGKDIHEIASWLEENKLHLCHLFTVDDLNHLFRGGRVSKASAVFGTMLGIKPVLHVDNNGKLVPIAKIRGRKQSLQALVDLMEKRAAGYENDVVFISHGDCLEDAEYVAQLVKERFGTKEMLINFVGQTIGAHSGPGTIALFFMGSVR